MAGEMMPSVELRISQPCRVVGSLGMGMFRVPPLTGSSAEAVLAKAKRPATITRAMSRETIFFMVFPPLYFGVFPNFPDHSGRFLSYLENSLRPSMA